MKRDLPAFCYRRKRGSASYVYFERAGQKAIRIKSDPGSPEFAREYADALAGRGKVPTKRTIRELIKLYLASPAFTEKAQRTQEDYRKHLGTIDRLIGHLSASAMQTKDVVRLRDSNAERVREANYYVQLVRIIMKVAKEKGWRLDNPATHVSLLKTPKAKAQPHMPWTDEAVATWRAKASPLPRLIMEMGIGTVQRPSDLTGFRWGDYDGDTLRLRQSKTGVALVLPCTEALKAVLDAEKARVTPHPMRHILLGVHGKRLTYRRMAEIMAAERKRLDTLQHDLHAMRYRGIMELAWAGCTDDEIASYSGHVSMQMIRKYAGEARQIMRARQAREKRR